MDKEGKEKTQYILIRWQPKSIGGKVKKMCKSISWHLREGKEV